MNEIIKTIFSSGTLGAEKIIIPQSKKNIRLNKKENELYGKLEAALSPELFKTLSEFIEILSERYAVINEQYYTAGFKIGLRLAMEAFNLSDVLDA